MALPGNQTYTSWSAMIWLEGAAEIGRCEWILPNDDVLFAELTTRQKKLNVRGKWQAEEKHELRKRGISSPSRADAVLGSMAVQDYQQMENVVDWKPWNEVENDNRDRSVLSKIGASAGYG
jgi:hypothetical protein